MLSSTNKKQSEGVKSRIHLLDSFLAVEQVGKEVDMDLFDAGVGGPGQ